MKYVLLLLLFTQPMLSYSQFFVGDSKDFVKTILQKNDIVFTENELTEETSRISWIIENEYQLILVLNTDEIVIRQTLIPEKENGVNEFVKWFNEDFVVISDEEWRNYLNGRIYKIKLEYIFGEPFFSITLAP